MKGLAVLFFWVFVAFLVWVIVAKKKGGSIKIQLIVCIAAFALFVLCTGLSGGKGASTTPEPTTTAPAITETTTAKPTVHTLDFEINAGEYGTYGKDLVLNKDTEFEDHIIGYFVPAGTYQVTNVDAYPTQVTVYQNKKVKQGEWEEWANGKAYLLDVQETKSVTVPEGYFIKVTEPTHIHLVQKK